MLALLAGIVFGLAATGTAAVGARRPNVILIIADDLNVQLGAYGSSIVKTPNLDRLAARGVRFDRAYSQSPICSPSRTSLLSGRRPETTFVLSNGTPPRSRLGDVPFLPEHFRAHGYRALGVGKIAHWTESLTWDTYVPGRRDRPESESETRGWSWRVVGNEAGLGDTVRAEAALRLLQQAHGQPFLLAVGFSLPHLPLVVPAEYLAMYPPDRIPLAGKGQAPGSFPEIAAAGRSGLKNLTEPAARRFRSGYFSAVSFVDSRVGLILRELDRLGLWETTVVIFTSDHGFLLGEHGLWGKHTLFDEATRVPLIVAAPGVRGGQTSRELVELVDLFPTLTEVCGLPKPSGLEGTSFLPLLADPARSWKTAAFTTDQRGKRAPSVRTQRYRYTRWPRGEEELYDHDLDPSEDRNLARDPSQKATLEEMRRILASGWQAARPKG